MSFKETEIGVLPEDWEIVKVDDVAQINEKTISKSYPFDEIEYVDIESVENRTIKQKNYLKLVNAPSRAKRIVRNNDILISTVRPNLKHYAIIKSASENTVASTGFAVITSKKIDPHFLYYYLTTDEYTEYLSRIADSHTSTYPAFNPDVIQNSLIAFPPPDEQTHIAQILTSLDNKIELNNQMNQTLEKIAKAIFKHWFVDFEFPNAEGKPYRSSGGEMIISELGENPESWVIGMFGGICKIQPGYAFKSKDFIEIGIKIIKIRNIQNSSIDIENTDHISENNIRNLDDKFIVHSGDILIAMTGAELGKVGIVPLTRLKLLLNQRVGKVVSNYKFFSYLLLTKYESQEMFKGISSASSAQGNISNKDIENIIINLPPENILELFESKMTPLFMRIYHNLYEIKVLSNLRDSLLPRLMNGKIRVNTDD